MVNIFAVYSICDTCDAEGRNMPCIMATPFFLQDKSEHGLANAKAIQEGNIPKAIARKCPYGRDNPHWSVLAFKDFSNQLSNLNAENCVNSEGKFVEGADGEHRHGFNRFAEIDMV